jgi:hypothetical protein
MSHSPLPPSPAGVPGAVVDPSLLTRRRAGCRPSFRPGPPALLWERIVPFLDTHLRE